MEPKLRFKEFSGDWEEKKLGDIANLLSSKRIYLSDYVEKGIPFYRGKEINELKNKKEISDLIFITKEKYDEIKNKYGVPQKNDLLITAVGTLGNTLVIQDEAPFYFKDGNLIWLKNIRQNVVFLDFILNSPNGKKKILDSAIGSTQKALTIVELNKLKFKFPSLPEQTKIADFLSTVDEKIQNQQDKITHLENIKKGFMQKIFSRKIRFKDANGNEFPEWEEKQLSKILKEGSKEKVNDTSQYRKITVKLNLKGINFSEIKRDMVDKRPFYIRYKDEIIIGKQNYFNGSIAIVDEIFDGCICSNAIMSFKVIRENLKFVYYYLSQSSYIAKNAYLANGTGQKELTEKDFLNMKIELPCLEEQQKIANFLSSFDEKIDAEKETLEHLKELKKGLLQQMFV